MAAADEAPACVEASVKVPDAAEPAAEPAQTFVQETAVLRADKPAPDMMAEAQLRPHPPRPDAASVQREPASSPGTPDNAQEITKELEEELLVLAK